MQGAGGEPEPTHESEMLISVMWYRNEFWASHAAAQPAALWAAAVFSWSVAQRMVLLVVWKRYLLHARIHSLR